MPIPPLPPEDAAALVRAAARTRNPERDLAIVALCLDAGPSRGELATARRADLDAGRGVLRLGCGRSTRVVRLGSVAMDALAAASSTDPHDDALIVSTDGRPITPRTIHEQLLTIGARAALGQGVTCRHLRNTFIASIARTYDLPTALRLAGHGSKRYPPATVQEALLAQHQAGWQSPLDSMVAPAGLRQVA